MEKYFFEAVKSYGRVNIPKVGSFSWVVGFEAKTPVEFQQGVVNRNVLLWSVHNGKLLEEMIDDWAELVQADIVVLRYGAVVVEVQGLKDGQEPVSGHDGREQARLQ